MDGGLSKRTSMKKISLTEGKGAVGGGGDNPKKGRSTIAYSSRRRNIEQT